MKTQPKQRFEKREAAKMVANRLVNDIINRLTDEEVDEIMRLRETVNQAQTALKLQIEQSIKHLLH